MRRLVVLAFVVAVSGFSSSLLSQTTAQEYFDSGHEKEIKSDFDGALADYNRASELDPKFAGAYVARGDLKGFYNGDDDGAIADSHRAIELDPKNASTYVWRGNFENSRGNKDL